MISLRPQRLTEFERWDDVDLENTLYVAREHLVTDIVDGMAADADSAEEEQPDD